MVFAFVICKLKQLILHLKHSLITSNIWSRGVLKRLFNC